MSKIVDNKKSYYTQKMRLHSQKSAPQNGQLLPSFCQALRYGREVRKTRSREKLKGQRDLGTEWRRKKGRCYSDIGIPAFGASLLGQIFSLWFRFLTLTCYGVFFFFSLSCILLITFLCYVLYVNSVIVCYLPPFCTRVLRVYQCNSVRGSSFFLGFPNHQPLLSSVFGKRLRFHRFLQFRFAVPFRQFFLYCTYYFFAL